MVKQYLEKTRDEFYDSKYALIEKLTAAENHFKENIKIIQMLEGKSDESFEAFTPREINSYNKSKVKELKEEQKLIEPQIKSLHKQISDVDCKIDEINSVIRVYNSDETTNEVEISEAISDVINEEDSDAFKRVILQTVESERQRIARDLHDSTVQSLTSLTHKTELCLKLMDVDPIRCRLELTSQGKILKDIINELRNMIYNLRPMSFDDIGFNITVERALDKLRNSNNIRCNFKTSGDEYMVDSLVSLTLLRVIQESCSNSIKHGHAKEINVSLKYEPKSLTLTIKDDGDGFDTSAIPEFTRNDNSGFGLSMMKERIYLLSGKISISSRPGEGCIVKVIIPVNKEDYIMAINIMITDDHSMIREGLKNLLELDGDIKVIAEAENGEECLDKLKTFRPDVLLLDINMPKMNGLEVLKALKDRKSKVKVLVLTVHNETEYLMKAVDIGINGYVLKDSESAELKKAIFTIADGETYIQPSLIPALNSKMIQKNEDELKIDALTKREMEVLKEMAVGKFNRDIAKEMKISERTVKNHISSIFKKLEVTDRTQAAVFAIRNNIIQIM